MRDKISWPLTADVFTFWDKLKISWFLFTERIWTAGAWVKHYEDMWVERFGVKHAIMVSSGSAANELIALRRKWELQRAGEWPRRNKVIFPVNTWVSSVTPWIHAGFEPVFVDISPFNLNVTAETLARTLSTDKDREIGTVFYTALLGYFGDIEACKSITEGYGAHFLMDNCEASFSTYDQGHGHNTSPQSILKLTTCSTSVYYSHFTTTGTEGGLIFTNDQQEADWYRMARNHGMTRGMPSMYRNEHVNADFDFHLLGSNYRSSNLQAYMGSLDLDRARAFAPIRQKIINIFYANLDMTKYQHFLGSSFLQYIPLALPIRCRSRDQRIKVEAHLKARGVLTRPLIAGCLTEHTAFRAYGPSSAYPVALQSHENDIYIGINKDITPKMARELAEELNNL